jgi:hypothetical protein
MVLPSTGYANERFFVEMVCLGTINCLWDTWGVKLMMKLVLFFAIHKGLRQCKENGP